MMEKAMVMLLVLVVTPSSSVNAVTPTSTQSCSFKTDSDQCCAFPFEFEGKVYSQCTADGSEGEWKQQWRNPWCVTGEKRLQSACLRYAHSCGGERDSPGVISSSGFPSGYRNGSQCDWLINMPAANQITLNFTDVSLSKDQSCDDAYVDIFDGDNSTYPLLGRICGNSIPPPVVSSGNQMLIKFRAMRSGVGLGRGFRAYFDSGECAVRTYGGNGHGACCVFPFTYKGHLYNTCITKDTGTAGVIGNPWCSVTDNYDRDKKRGLCVTENVTCHPTWQFTCNNNHWWKQCIDISYKCDGKPECADHSDENDCPPLINPDRCNVIHIYQPRNKKHPFVWKLSRKCGYTNRCTLNTTQEERDAPCKISSWFKCRSGVCIPPQWICDGKDDCGDRSDESVGRCEYKDKKPSSCSWINDCKKTVNAWEKKFGEGVKSIQNTVVCYAKNTTTIPNYLPHTTTSM